MTRSDAAIRRGTAGLLFVVLTISAAGCATLGDQEQPLIPTRYETRTGPFEVFSNFQVAPDAPAIKCLHTLETDIETSLGIHVTSEQAPVEVYILRDRAAFSHFLTFYYPELPPRRAFFIAQGERRVVYTFLGDRLEEDLRHEATHALLNVAVGDMPLWLDEGLAEYFEGPEGRHGLNPEHLARLPQDLASGWTPDLAKLEALKSVREMSPRDYRESWGWIYYLLNGSSTGKTVLLTYLDELRRGEKANALAGQIPSGEKGAATAMLAHLERVRQSPVAAVQPPAEPTVRLQDNSVEPARIPSAPPKRKSLLGRLGALFGF